ncbi:histidinol-phosphate aminotransferase family protein [Akkermansiaceae bacterium]|nr:histidinol-phosphate aminotransferase family protein [Akkermansiaceae bacterium]
MNAPLISLSIATRHDRERISRLRHAVYARELGQHSLNRERSLTDSLDLINHYLVAKSGNILPGAGSSDLIFRAFRQWLTKDSRVLIFDPTYGEYLHVLEHVIGCQISRLKLDAHANYDVDLLALRKELSTDFDLIVLVNPNSPTGRHVSASALEAILSTAPPSTRIWIDETYLDYVSKVESLEQFAAQSENVLVCKSMSKVYALSGARAAYLCAGPHQLEALRAITPPWVIGLPSQLAAVRALENQAYYDEQYQQTHHLRRELAAGLIQLGWLPIPGVANFILCRLPDHGPSPSEIIETCRIMNLFLRDPGSMGTSPDQRLIRIAVKDAPTNARMLQILKVAISSLDMPNWFLNDKISQ